MAEHETVPNHHAHYGSFSGVGGVLAATTMLFGRTNDARIAFQLSAVASGDVVLDLGCGPGAAARFAARRGVTVIGVDPASVMLRVARMLTWAAPGIRYVEGVAERVPLDDASVAGAWSIASVHHWHDVSAGLREVRRVVQPGGRFVAIEHRVRPNARGHASHGWTEAQANAFAAAARTEGFVDVTVQTHTAQRRHLISVVAIA
jgi:ubiquinone/menaquinone biosynthesis C-methylase UbiE